MTSLSTSRLGGDAGFSDALAEPGAAPPFWPRGTREIRYGGDYNPEQWPRETWLRDIDLMREAGVNLVSIGIFSWALLEPTEGEFDFHLLDEVMDLLAGAGIDVDLGTPTAAPPAWFWKRYPDSAPVTRDGVVLGRGSRGIVSPSSPDYRRAATRIADRLAARYADHPALVMWHVHNEYGAPVSESYDAHSVLAFRAWLQRRYGSLDALNAAWGTRFWGQMYGFWDEIDAPRQAATVVNQTQRLDFARFSSDALLECFVGERDAIRRHTPDLPITTNFMATNCPSVDYWKWAREVDVVANDHYLKAERTDNHVLLAMDADLTRSLAGGRPWILMEHSTSAVNWQPRNLAKRPGELARNSMSHFGRGADGVLFFQFRASRYGAEKFHSAMLPHSGPDSRIWKEVVALGQDLRRLGEVQGSQVRTRIAILWDWESFWAQDLEWRPSVELSHRRAIEQYYSALWNRRVTVDFVHPEADLTGYAVLLAPQLYLVSKRAGENLSRFVADGGRLVVGFASALVDEDDAVPDGGYLGPLAEPLGLRVEEFLPFAEDEAAPLSSGGTGSLWADDLRLEGAQPLSVFTSGRAEGRPAVTRNAFGRGTAWYVSTRLDDQRLGTLLEDVLVDTGIPVGPANTGMEVVERSDGASRFRIAINHAESDQELSATGAELLTGEAVSGSLRVPAGSVRIVRIGTDE
ncbi:beta-galactosidase [Amnibacterium kyonggiense]|uniref:Beta-galactosidase n=1 Tax=Amnibacterium kyonggiense TaxID=595671 RepID=A0A4R7FGI3_9MICO|nr:beta-galactosidase [Amnibacterium kyonggiense]TDS76080.1 beta-galactosidase [Amnibacterium kyonggiense]